jgi:hypothetical protein
MPMLIRDYVLRALEREARLNEDREYLGWLISQPGEVAITGAYLLNAKTTSCSAEAAPLSVKKAVNDIRRSNNILRGMVHSHGRLGVGHSATDTDTIHRLLPAMAEQNFARPNTPATPWVEASSCAFLPLPSGLEMVVRLIPLDSSAAAFEPPCWTYIRFAATDTREPGVHVFAGRVELVAGGTVLILGLPDGWHISSAVEDRSAARVAHLFSLIVNSRGNFEAKCLVIAEMGEKTFLRLDPCEILAVYSESTIRGGGRFLVRGEDA